MSSNARSEEEQTKHPFKIKGDPKEVYLGHTSVTNWTLTTPYKAGQVWNLDTGAGFDGKLTLLDINTKEYWQSDNVKTLYKDEKGR